MTDQPVLLAETRDGVRHVTLNRPERLNAINHPLAEAMLAEFEGLRRNTEARVVVLSGAGRAFSAGADLKAGGTPEALRDGPNGDWVLRDLLKAMRACPQPIVCLVKGAAAGGGLAMVLASDIVYAGETAAFHTAFIKIGLSGSELGAAWRMQRTMGVSRAREALFTGDPIDAAEACRTGLVSRVVPDADLEAAGAELTAKLLRAAPDALRVTKRSMDVALEIGAFDAAMEADERGQMLMIRAGREAARAAKG